MNIPGFERDEDGTLVIEISPTMRLVILAGALIFACVVIWWVAIKKEETKQRSISRVPQDILRSEDFAPDNAKPDPLLEVESSIGVSPHSLLSIERVGGADRDELERIFTEIVNRGLPNLDSEEAQLYSGLIERSAEIAPNRALRFYDRLEGEGRRAYSISQLYKRWIELNPLEALETARLVEEPLRFRTLARDLPALAETQPAEAFEAALLTRDNYFTFVEPNFIRPVMRTWAKKDFDAATKAALKVNADAGRREAVQGLALGKLDQASKWADAQAWASNLDNREDRLWAALAVVEMGIHKHFGEVADAVKNFPNQSLKQHLVRLVEARRLALDESPGERHLKTWQLYRSTDPYDPHGRLCVLNTFEDMMERETEAIRLRSRWRDLAEKTYVADGHVLYGEIPQDVPQKPLINLLDRGARALDSDDLKSAEQDFLTYLHYNPNEDDVDPYFIRYSKAAGTWLGPDAGVLDEIVVPANVVPETTDFFAVMANLAEEYKKQTDKDLPLYVFEAISGAKPDMLFSWGEHGEVTLREALDALTLYSGLVIYHKEYGIVGFYFRDEDVAISMGAPIEFMDYPIEKN